MKRLFDRASGWIRRAVSAGNQQLRSELVPAVRELVARVQESPAHPDLKNPLNRCGACFFSQNDEDGILLEILKRIGCQPSLFLEIGVGNGLVNNTLVLLAHRWEGIWIGGEPIAFDPQNSRLLFEQKWVTAETIVSLVSSAAARLAKHPENIRVISLDIDGNDYHVAKALLQSNIRPEVFIVEYNAKFPPTVDFVMPSNPGHRWKSGTDYFGASLKSWVTLLADYQLVACNLTGANAFFVDVRHQEKFSDVPRDIDALFIPGSYHPIRRSGWATTPETVEYFIKA